jgi:hypothetical protein
MPARLGGPSVGVQVKLLIEIESTQLKGKPVWFVCTGNQPVGFKYPSQIFRKYKSSDPKSVVPPNRLGSQAINTFTTTELVGILKSSSLFEKILKAIYYDSALLLAKLVETSVSSEMA